ncbi:MAG: (E)-4-hydroxy-3-methylbut-2-enyl-diphosphate synthase [Flavobacteriales bacterium]|nr:(E)-4-hydroxy-3-methylbut-2-enyl-diphosphate synthase [Flavobacteriales bacterium]MCB9363682.1 (E)-4-hydroxy-3-methylbut-2-enyl-diphosphate synthase [Flavobacteriales bacterium]
MYCNSLTNYQRFKTREVKVGNIGIGGKNPIRIQSMTTTDTMDTIATVEQSIRMINAGCEIVRITAPSKKEAENLANIKAELVKRGYNTPLVADIHFTPNAAEIAATIVEKVRINPGNYADKKKFEELEYTDESYKAELARIRERFIPLVKICKQYGTAMRIGTNHGSLSDRIMSRFGDSPLGMVESAMEFLRICREFDYHDIVLSMKASNTLIVVQAYRLLVSKMIAEEMNYPLHLGVTEAGDGEDGRIKSAVGIGTLLEDGLGDTIRVSLTEEPEFEIPVAQDLVKRYNKRSGHDKIEEIIINPLTPFEYNKRQTNEVLNIGGKNVPVVIHDFCSKEKITPASFFALGYNYSVPLDKWNLSDLACDYVFLGDKVLDFEVPGTLGLIYNYKTWINNKDKGYPFLTAKEYLNETELSLKMNMVYTTLPDLSLDLIKKLKNDTTATLMIDTHNGHGMAEQRKIFIELINNNCTTPVIIGRAYSEIPPEEMQLHASTDIGALFVDGLGDGIFIAAEMREANSSIQIKNNKNTERKNGGSDKMINDTAFGILQASRTRISKTEYISCPSCGRTLFDLQETTAKIRAVTSHLKGVKIGIMGCIVNGPGEMADADYGYVGTGLGKITLYKEKNVVRKNIPEAEAVDALINLIKEHGDWVDA